MSTVGYLLEWIRCRVCGRLGRRTCVVLSVELRKIFSPKHAGTYLELKNSTVCFSQEAASLAALLNGSEIFLYSMIHPLLGHVWAISDTVGNQAGFAFLFQDVATPDLGTRAWEVFQDSDFNVKAELFCGTFSSQFRSQKVKFTCKYLT